jgi:hypothetical protein
MKQLMIDMKQFLIVTCIFVFLLIGFTAYHFYEEPDEKAKIIAEEILEKDFSEIPVDSKEQVASFVKEVESIEHNYVDISTTKIQDDQYILVMIRIMKMSSDNSTVMNSYYGEIKLEFERISWTENKVVDVKTSHIK